MTLFTNDPRLLEAFRRGEAAALRQVYLAYGNTVYGVIKNGFTLEVEGTRRRFSGCASEHDAEELLQEAFRRAFEERARIAYDGIRPYQSYLLMIARNLLIDELRKHRPRLFDTEEALERAQNDTVEPQPGPHARAENRELMRLVESFRDELTERERGVFDARFVEQLDQNVVAERLGMSLYRARTSEQQLRRRLLVFLRRHGYLTRLRQAVDCEVESA